MLLGFDEHEAARLKRHVAFACAMGEVVFDVEVHARPAVGVAYVGVGGRAEADQARHAEARLQVVRVQRGQQLRPGTAVRSCLAEADRACYKKQVQSMPMCTFAPKQS